MVRETLNHVVVYGITLEKFKLEHAFLEFNPDFNGRAVIDDPLNHSYWRKSKTLASDLINPEERECFRIESGNKDLLCGWVFPDGRIDRNLVEAGVLKNPVEVDLGNLCYLGEYGKQTLGKLLLRDTIFSASWRQLSHPDDLAERLGSPDKLVQAINQYGFAITPQDLEIVQVFFTTNEKA